jgi:hypothetical protein
MAEALTATEIEDVLASIRRLVSEDLRPQRPPAATAGRLILTPALRVADPAPGATEAALSRAVSDDAAIAAASRGLHAVADIGRPDEFHWLSSPPVADHGRVFSILTRSAGATADANDLEAADAGAAEPVAGPGIAAAWRADAPAAEPEPGAKMPRLVLALPENARPADAGAMPAWAQGEPDWDAAQDSVAEGPVPFRRSTRGDLPVGPIDAADGAGAALPAEAVLTEAAPEAVAMAASDPGAAPAEPLAAEAMPQIASDATPAMTTEVAAEAPVAETAPAPAAAPGADDALSPEEMGHLRTIIADVVREELRGDLGEQVTRKLRQMIREEIARTMFAPGKAVR